MRSYGQVLHTIAHRDFRRPSGVSLGLVQGTGGTLDPAEFGSPEGEVLVEQRTTQSAMRVVMSRGITRPFETRKGGINHVCMIGGIERSAGITVYKPDDGMVHCPRWRPFDPDAVFPPCGVGAKSRGECGTKLDYRPSHRAFLRER